MRTSLLCWTPPHVFKKISPIFVITCRFQPSFCSLFFIFLKSTDLPEFVQRPVQRPKTASSVPLRSWWRRSSRLRGCGRTTTRVRGSSWRISSSRAAAGPAAATAPSPETPTKSTEVTPGKERGSAEPELGRSFEERSLSERSAAPSRLCFICTPPLQLACHSPPNCSDERNT